MFPLPMLKTLKSVNIKTQTIISATLINIDLELAIEFGNLILCPLLVFLLNSFSYEFSFSFKDRLLIEPDNVVEVWLYWSVIDLLL